MGSTPPSTHSLEELSDRAMPGRERHRFGDWTCRAADGATSRANSCSPLGDPGQPVATAIAAVEQWFAERSLATIFQIWDGTDPEVTDHLDQHDYHRSESAEVLVLHLESARLPPASARVELSDGLAALNGTTAGTTGLAELDLSPLPKVAATAFDAEALMGSGIGVIDGSALGLFAMATVPEYRRQGLAAAMLTSLLHAGAEVGATHAWLQVMPSNEPAKRLYRAFGFDYAHGYHYRVRA